MHTTTVPYRFLRANLNESLPWLKSDRAWLLINVARLNPSKAHVSWAKRMIGEVVKHVYAGIEAVEISDDFKTANCYFSNASDAVAFKLVIGEPE